MSAAPIVDLWIPGQPVPKGRPRVRRNGSVYTPPATQAAERNLQWNFLERRIRPVEGPLRVAVDFRRRTRRRCDIDNLQKLVLDAANGLVWHDDSQVRKIGASVEFGCEEPGTRLRVWELR